MGEHRVRYKPKKEESVFYFEDNYYGTSRTAMKIKIKLKINHASKDFEVYPVLPNDCVFSPAAFYFGGSHGEENWKLRILTLINDAIEFARDELK